MAKTYDLQKDSIFRLVLHFSLPMMLAQFINVLYTIVDRIFIGNIPIIGDAALSGVGVCGPITTLITSFACLVGMGGAPLFAIALGEKNKAKAQQILSNSFLLLGILAVIVMIGVFLFKTPLLLNFGASETTYSYADQYLTIYSFGIIFSVLALGLNQFITAQGNAKMAMVSVIVGAAINILLDALFIQLFHMGVMGAAIATVIGQFLSFAISLYFLFSKHALVRIHWVRPNFRVMKHIMKMGFSPFLISATDSIVFIVLNGSLQRYGGMNGDLWVSVSTIAQSYFSLITLPLLGISTGTQPILSYNYGANNFRRIKKAEKTIVLFAICFTTLCFILTLLFSRSVISIFTQNEWIITQAIRSIQIFVLCIIILPVQYCFVDGLTGLAQPQYAIWLSLFRKIGMILLFMLLPTFLQIDYVFLGEPIMDLLASILSFIVFLKVLPRIEKKREIEYGRLSKENMQKMSLLTEK